MIDIKTERGKTDINKIDGNFADLAADTLIILNVVYETIYDVNPAAADSFAGAVKSRISSKRDTPFRIIDES